MEKFRFQKKLTEAVLKYENGHPYVVVESEKRNIRSPVLLWMDSGSIGDEGIPCLISEGDASEVTVLAVLFDDLPRDKKWLCVSSLMMDQAVGFFLEHHLMERMVNHYESITRQTFADYVVDDNCVIELKLRKVGVNKEIGSFVVVDSIFQPIENLRKSFERIILHSAIRRVILLILLPFKGNSLLKTSMNEKVMQVLEDAAARGLVVEFWTAEMQFETDGISLISYENVTDMLTNVGMD